MLYTRWQEVARRHSSRMAVWDVASGRRFSFHELAQAGHSHPASNTGFEFARGAGVDFILSVLAAWREGRVLVPLEEGQSEPATTDPIADGIVHLKTTSATTGSPRFIAFTGDQLAADCRNVVSTMGLDSSLPNVGAISLAHSYGFSNLVLPLLLEGIPLVLASSPLPESVRLAAEQVPEVALPAVPAMWQAWSEAGVLSDRIRIAISAGAPLPISLEQQVFDSSGIKIHNFYGASECGGIAYDRTDAPRTDASRVGTLMDGVEVRLNDQGCMAVQSAAVGSQYWPGSDAALAGGVYHSGDLGELIDGAVHLRGRASDSINVAGRKVVPEEVERALAGHPAVRDCLVFGVPAEGVRNEQVVACVVLGDAATPDQLAAFLSSSLPSWQLPRDWWVLNKLGVNQRGKRSRAEWRERYLSEQGAQ